MQLFVRENKLTNNRKSEIRKKKTTSKSIITISNSRFQNLKIKTFISIAFYIDEKNRFIRTKTVYNSTLFVSIQFR